MIEGCGWLLEATMTILDYGYLCGEIRSPTVQLELNLTVYWTFDWSLSIIICLSRTFQVPNPLEDV